MPGALPDEPAATTLASLPAVVVVTVEVSAIAMMIHVDLARVVSLQQANKKPNKRKHREVDCSDTVVVYK